MIVGRNLSLNSGTSYLWWPNGMNRGTQVPPTITRTARVGDLLGNGLGHDTKRHS